MRFKAEKEILLGGIQTTQGVITTKTALPILSHILMETQPNTLKLTTTDLDVGITCVVPVDIQEQGAITVPAKRFGDIIKELPTNEVIITTKKNNLVNIETELCQVKIAGLAAEEFPRLPELKDKEVIQLEQGILKEMLNLTSFVVSFDETRYALSGILFEINKDNLTLVATDGKRLAIVEKKLRQNTDKEIQIIVPFKTVQELNRNLKEEAEELLLTIATNQALFDLKNVVIISRLIEDRFPNYQQVIPPVSEHKVEINREQFFQAIKRAALLATPDYQAIKLEVFKERLVVSKSTPDVGESWEEIAIKYSGKEMVIGFNPNYLLDVLKNLSCDKVEFELTDSEKPGAIRTDGYTYIVLPMRLG